MSERRDFTFTPFDRSTAQFVKAPTVTIQAAGTFSFNASAFKELGSMPYVELFYDVQQHVIAFKGERVETLRTYPIRRQGPKANVWLVAGKAFLAHFEIEHKIPTRYLAESIDGMLIVDLAKGGAKVLSNRTKARMRTAAEILDEFLEPEPNGQAPGEAAARSDQ